MDDARDLVLVERPLDGGELGDVALDDLEPVEVVAEHELEAVARVAEVVADDVVTVVEHAARDPGAEAAEHAGDEDSLSHAGSPVRSSGAPLEQVGGRHDGVRQRADLGNVDLDHVTRQQGEVVGRHEARAREEHATRRHRVVADEPADEVGERPLHPRRRRLAGEEHRPVGVRGSS